MVTMAAAARGPGVVSGGKPRRFASFQNSRSPSVSPAATNSTKSGWSREIKMDEIRKGSAMAAVKMRCIKIAKGLEQRAKSLSVLSVLFVFMNLKPVSGHRSDDRAVGNRLQLQASGRGENLAKVFR